MKRLLSGITPSGDGSLHLGNFFGAVKQFIELSATHECFLMFADLHALTTVQNKTQLIKNTEALILNEIALVEGMLEKFGGKRDNIIFFRQSDVPMHTELQSILNNVTPLGLLKRAHAYKDKLAKDVMEDDINVGLFSYPMLMAADILLYKPEYVPVGKDQAQHIEIAQDIAEKFNHIFRKDVFTYPKPHIQDDLAVILGIDGKRKMSKSLGNVLSIFESEEIIKKQIMSCYTDPQRKSATDKGTVEGNMVFAYLDLIESVHTHDASSELAHLKERYRNGAIGDVELKEILITTYLTFFAPARKRYGELQKDAMAVKTLLAEGAKKANAVAIETMKEVRQTVGLVNAYSTFQYPTVSVDGLITIDQFAAVSMRVGNVLEATHPEKSEKLIRLVVDFGSEKRIIFTGVRPYGYTKDDFIGKQFFFVTNLAPRKMLGEESQGMILAVDGPNKPLFVSAEGMPIGSAIR